MEEAKSDPLTSLANDSDLDLLGGGDDEFLKDLEYLTSSSNTETKGSKDDAGGDTPTAKNDKSPTPPKPARSESNTSSNSALLAALKLEEEMAKETKDLFVHVDDPEKHTTTMESFITFRIITKTTRSEYDTHEYCVRRRYNDFLWLRQKLEEEYTTLLVPPLPAKESLKRLDHFSKEFIVTRAKGLARFMGRVADHPVLSFSKSLQVFLTAKNAEFLAHKKQGSGLFTRMADSIHNMSAAYMIKNRSPEHVFMQEYVTSFSEKLAAVDRISQRIFKEQIEYLHELRELSPVFTLWSNSEDKLSQALSAIAVTTEKCLEALKEVLEASETEFQMPLKEYMLYADAVKAVLRRRDGIQMEYDITLDELNRRKDEKEQLNTSEQTSYSIGSFMGKNPEEIKQQKQEKVDQQIEELTSQVELFNDRAVVANADLKADMERWHANKKRDMKEMFIQMADKHIEYYQKCLTAWEEAIPMIQQSDNLVTSNADVNKGKE